MKFLITFVLLFSVAFAQTEKVYFSDTIADTTINFSLTDTYNWSANFEYKNVTVSDSTGWPQFYLLYKCDNCTLYDTLISDSARQANEMIIYKYDYNSVYDYQFKIVQDSVSAGTMKFVITKFK